MLSLNQLINRDLDMWKAFPYLMMISVFFYFSGLSFFSIPIDAEFSALRNDPTIWASQGRWTAYLVERFLVPQSTIPFLPLAMFCVCMSVSYILVLISHNLKINWRSYLLYPVFCAFPIWICLTNFSTNAPSASIAILLTSMAIYLFRAFTFDFILAPNAPRLKLFPIIIQALLIAAAIGAYQTFLLLFMSYGFGVILMTSVSGETIDSKKFMKIFTVLAFTIFLSFLFYTLIQYAFLFLFNMKTVYIEAFFHPGRWLEGPMMLVEEMFWYIVQNYSGDPIIYSSQIYAMVPVMLLGAFSVFSSRDGHSTLLKIFLIISLLLIPFSLYIVGGGVNPRSRTLIAIPYVVWIFGYLACTNRQVLLKALSICAVSLTIFQSINIASMTAANKSITLNHDRMLAQSIYQRMVSLHPDFDRHKSYPIDFFGALPLRTIYPALTEDVNQVSSLFQAQNGSPLRMIHFMKIIGFNNLSFMSKEDRTRLIPHYDGMPIWPAAGSVKVVDGITLVKLGNEIGLY
jgi:hypothetical protein